MRTAILIAATVAGVLAVPAAGALAQDAAPAAPAAPLPAAPAPVTPEGAQALQQGLKTWLTEMLRRQEDTLAAVFDGGITVEPQGDLYQAAIPPATLTIDDTRVGIGRIDLALRPLVNGWFDTRWTLPSRYDFVDRQAETATLTIGSQRGTGVFAPEFHTFMSIDAALNNVVLAPPRNQGRLALGAVAVTGTSQEKARGIFDGAWDLRVEGVEVADTASGFRVGLGGFGMDGAVAAIRLADYLAFAERLQALTDEAAAAPAGRPQDFGAIGQLVDRTPRLFDGFNGRYWVRDLQATVEGMRVALGTASFGTALSGLEGAAADLAVTLDVGGLAIQPPLPFGQFIPGATRIDLALTGLPNQAMLETLKRLLHSAQQAGPEAAMLMAGMELQQAVTTAGSQLRINALRLESDAATVDLTGSVSPAPASPFGVSARASLVLRGFEAVIAELRRQPDGQQPIQAVTLLQTMGTAATDAQGRAIRRYEIEVTPAGVVMMNGTDVRPLFEQFMGP